MKGVYSLPIRSACLMASQGFASSRILGSKPGLVERWLRLWCEIKIVDPPKHSGVQHFPNQVRECSSNTKQGHWKLFNQEGWVYQHSTNVNKTESFALPHHLRSRRDKRIVVSAILKECQTEAVIAA